jgi:hypothetical protein
MAALARTSVLPKAILLGSLSTKQDHSREIARLRLSSPRPNRSRRSRRASIARRLFFVRRFFPHLYEGIFK